MIVEPTWQDLARNLDARALIEVVMLIGHCEMLAGVRNSTGLSLDSCLEGVLAAAPVHPRHTA